MARNDPHRCDVAVVGAGPNGLLAAECLERLGHRALLLEAGPLLPSGAIPPAADEEEHWAFRSNPGLKGWRRTHAVGGKSLGWGGYMFRFPQAVFADGDWPYSARTLAPWYREAARWIGVAAGSVTSGQRRAAARLGWPIVPLQGARRCGRIFTGRDAAAAVRAKTGQLVLGLDLADGTARALDILDLAGQGRTALAARAVVLACSPLESARLLLACGLKRDCAALGEGLVDHPAVGFILVERTCGRGMDGPELLNGALIPRFVNVGPGTERDYFGGFSLEIVGPMPLTSQPRELAARLSPEGADPSRCQVTYINAMGETSPLGAGRISLCRTSRDAWGRPQLRIHHPWRRENGRLVRDMTTACIRYAEEIAVPGSELILHQSPSGQRVLFHEAGVCRMGSTESAPCDAFGRFRTLRNVWIADAAAFPSAGDRHPTLTVLAHTLRVVRSVDRHLRRVSA